LQNEGTALAWRLDHSQLEIIKDVFRDESERLAVRIMTEGFRTTCTVLWNVVGDGRSSGRGKGK